MRLIDADALIELIENSNCKDCNHYNYIKCRACPTDDAVTYIDEAPTVGEWISVEDRLPETSQEVLIFSRTEKSGTGYVNVVLYSAKFKAFNCTDDCDEYKVKNVTHWMPLPKAPEE